MRRRSPAGKILSGLAGLTTLVCFGVACDRLPRDLSPGGAVPASPTPNVQATVQAAVAATLQPTVSPSPAPSGRYLGGFADFHRWYPELIGEPLRDEYGPWPGMSIQQTTKGVLIWVEGRDLVFVANDGRLFTWDPSTRSLNVQGPS
jgi:hypothetical protein